MQASRRILMFFSLGFNASSLGQSQGEGYATLEFGIIASACSLPRVSHP